jgi:hypothetical protein
MQCSGLTQECEARSQHTAGYKLFENAANFRYLGTTFTNQIRIHEGILRKYYTQRKPITTDFRIFPACCLKMYVNIHFAVVANVVKWF